MNDIQKNIENIRTWLAENKLDAIIIPHDDEYLSEYIPPENERLAWITNFTGSAGVAYISMNKAAIFVDGRYTVQVKQQVDSNIFTILQLAEISFIDWLKTNISENSHIAYDPRLHRVNWITNTQKALENVAKLQSVQSNPIDIYWKDRPKAVTDTAILLDEKYTGKSSQQKRQELGDIIHKNKADAAFLTKLDSIAWLLNIRGNDVPCNPVLLCHAILYTNGAVDLFIDNRKIPELFSVHVGENVDIYPPDSIKDRLEHLSGKIVQLDFNNSNAWSKDILEASGITVIEKEDPCTMPKACKNNIEVQGMKNCHIRDAIAVCNFLSWIDTKVNAGNLYDEGVLSDTLDSYRAKLENFRGISFGTISAAGKNAAMCHYSHKNQEAPGMLEMDSVYLVDSGGQYLDGTTDITRTVAIGNPSEFMQRAFTLVLQGHIALGSAQFPEGIAGQHLDTLARQFLWHHGYDYEHGTGHGVGSYLNVHEGPQGIGKGANNVPLKEGMILSNEPGYYEENEFGIRCENLVVVKRIENNEKTILGFENLTFVPFDVRLMVKRMLTIEDKKWINTYHADVLEKIGPHVEGDVKDWLIKSTKTI